MKPTSLWLLELITMSSLLLLTIILALNIKAISSEEVSNDDPRTDLSLLDVNVDVNDTFKNQELNFKENTVQSNTATNAINRRLFRHKVRSSGDHSRKIDSSMINDVAASAAAAAVDSGNLDGAQVIDINGINQQRQQCEGARRMDRLQANERPAQQTKGSLNSLTWLDKNGAQSGRGRREAREGEQEGEGGGAMDEHKRARLARRRKRFQDSDRLQQMSDNNNENSGGITTVLNAAERQADTNSLKCRLEKNLYLDFEEYKHYTCANCYNYLPKILFSRKLLYKKESRIWLYDEHARRTLPNDTNTIRSTFKDQATYKKWQACCRHAIDCCIQNSIYLPRSWNSKGELVDEKPRDKCPATWDGFGCWPDSPAGQVAEQDCPEHVYVLEFMPVCKGQVQKQCFANGSWFIRNDHEWSDYNRCAVLTLYATRLLIGSVWHLVSAIVIGPALIILNKFPNRSRSKRVKILSKLLFWLLLNGLLAATQKIGIIGGVFDANVNPDELPPPPSSSFASTPSTPTTNANQSVVHLNALGQSHQAAQQLAATASSAVTMRHKRRQAIFNHDKPSAAITTAFSRSQSGDSNGTVAVAAAPLERKQLGKAKLYYEQLAQSNGHATPSTTTSAGYYYDDSYNDSDANREEEEEGERGDFASDCDGYNITENDDSGKRQPRATILGQADGQEEPDGLEEPDSDGRIKRTKKGDSDSSLADWRQVSEDVRLNHENKVEYAVEHAMEANNKVNQNDNISSIENEPTEVAHPRDSSDRPDISPPEGEDKLNTMPYHRRISSALADGTRANIRERVDGDDESERQKRRLLLTSQETPFSSRRSTRRCKRSSTSGSGSANSRDKSKKQQSVAVVFVCWIFSVGIRITRLLGYAWMFTGAVYLCSVLHFAPAEPPTSFIKWLMILTNGFPVVIGLVYVVVRTIYEPSPLTLLVKLPYYYLAGDIKYVEYLLATQLDCWMLQSHYDSIEEISDFPNLVLIILNGGLFVVTLIIMCRINRPGSTRPEMSLGDYFKAAGTLVLLYGAHYALFVYRPIVEGCIKGQIVYYSFLFVDGIQGIAVSYVFCYRTVEGKEIISKFCTSWRGNRLLRCKLTSNQMIKQKREHGHTLLNPHNRAANQSTGNNSACNGEELATEIKF